MLLIVFILIGKLILKILKDGVVGIGCTSRLIFIIRFFVFSSGSKGIIENNVVAFFVYLSYSGFLLPFETLVDL